jgi:hypothetical protein
MTAEDRLRNQLLRDMLGDVLPMAHVHSVINREDLADTVSAKQDLAVRTVRSLLQDGLMQIGDVSGGDPAKLIPWELSLDDAMARLQDRFVRHYEEPAMWVFSFWFGLTETGERVAKTLRPGGTTSDE